MMTDAYAAEAVRAAGDPTPLRERVPVRGGDISRAFRLRTERRSYLLKIGGGGLPGFFRAEADGLERIAATGAVRTPRVFAWRDGTEGNDGFLLQEWIETLPGGDREAAATLGRELAALHRASAPQYGLDSDGYIGASPQPNGWMPGWLAFFRERRLGSQIALAERNGRLTPERARRLDRLLARLGEWIDDDVVRPSLLHGDLWGGNWLIGPNGAPVLIDPACYYGDREADLALTQLFGGFPRAFYDAYQEAWPLANGWRERREIYNLYHLLNHLNLFGEGYGGGVDAVLQRFA